MKLAAHERVRRLGAERPSDEPVEERELPRRRRITPLQRDALQLHCVDAAGSVDGAFRDDPRERPKDRPAADDR